jgi:arginyl-tRNA synthetase
LKSQTKLPKIDTLTEAERSLIQMLLQFPHVLEEARAEHLPHKLTNFLYSLCQEFNAFYNKEPILQADEPHKGLRLALTSLTASVLKTGAELLTLRVPERM